LGVWLIFNRMIQYNSWWYKVD